MAQYITGNLDSVMHARKIKFVYGILLSFSLVSFTVYLVRSVKLTQGIPMINTEFRFLVIGLVLMSLLFISFLKSMIQL